MPIALAIAMAVQLAFRTNTVTSTESSTIPARGAQTGASVGANPIPGEEFDYPGDSLIKTGQRIVELDRPGGLSLAYRGAIVEVVSIGNGNGTISAVPIASNAVVIARSDTATSLLVSESEAHEILASQALGSVAILATAEQGG